MTPLALYIIPRSLLALEAKLENEAEVASRSLYPIKDEGLVDDSATDMHAVSVVTAFSK